MTESTSFDELMEHLAAGNDEAAEAIVDQYTSALVAVARREIGPKLGRRIDPEDVVQSAYRSFFLRMEKGEYELGTGRELWKLLVTIMLNKVRRQGNYHHALKRNVNKERSTRHAAEELPESKFVSNEPGPEAAAMLVEELSAFLDTLRVEDREIVELRLQGYSTVEIATQSARAERTVRRVLENVRRKLTERQRHA